jgi:hypothetical protein
MDPDSDPDLDPAVFSKARLQCAIPGQEPGEAAGSVGRLTAVADPEPRIHTSD